MTQQLVYTLDDLGNLPLGTVVRAHRDLALADYHTVLVRQPSGWYGAWDWDMPIDNDMVIPCTVLHRSTP